MKVARINELNDPFELLAVNLADREHRKAFRYLKDELNKTKGILCFTKFWENPVIWGHYADKHTGIALGFEVPPHIAAEAIYADEPLAIPIDPVTNKPNPDEELMDKLVRTKFSDWKYEQEWRVFVQLDHSSVEAGMYFYDFSDHLQLAEVILGPRCAIPITKVRSLVSDFKPGVEVRQSRIAFQSFRVVENKEASRG